MEEIRIGIRTYSDHAPILARWKFKSGKGGMRVWRLDNYLLMNKEVIVEIQKDMNIFLKPIVKQNPPLGNF